MSSHRQIDGPTTSLSPLMDGILITKTENKLICFGDGSYIGRIAFADDDRKHSDGHRWGDKQHGVIDFAFATYVDPEIHFISLKKRLDNLGVSDWHGNWINYAPPISGGRRRDEGQDVKLKVTFPLNVRRGDLPFFCHDVKSRDL